MSDYTSHIDTEAIELDLMERYLEGSLSADEQREMEESLAEDPILADALEGLALIEDKEEMKLALGRIREGSRRQINRYIKKRDQLSKRRSRVEHGNFKRTNYYVAAAAAVAVLVCTVWVIDMSSNKASVSYAQANEVSEKQSLPELTESEIVLAPSVLDSLVEKADSESTGNELIAEGIVNSRSNTKDLRQENMRKDSYRPTSDEVNKESSLIASEDKATDDEEEVVLEKEVHEPLGKVLAKPAPAPAPAPVASAPSSDQLTDRKDKIAETAPLEIPLARKQEELTTDEADLASNIQPSKADTAPILSEAELNSIQLEEDVTEEVTDDVNEYALESKRSKKIQSREARAKNKTDAYKTIDLPAQSEEDIAYGKIAKGQHMADLMVEAVALYEAGSNDKSLVLLKEVLQTSPENPAANYYAGSIYRKYSQMKTATSHLKAATKYPESPLIEEARWELAKVYLARNKNGLAKKLLLKIATESNKFAEQAREELSKLN